MIKGVGVDSIEIERVGKALENPRFLARVFTPRERAFITGRGTLGTQSAAGLFAAKEAVVKALGTGFNGISLHDVEITHTDSGAPVVRLYGAAAAPGCTAHISITHDKTKALAFCVLEQAD